MISKILTINFVFPPSISVKVEAQQLPLATTPLLAGWIELGGIWKKLWTTSENLFSFGCCMYCSHGL